MAVIRDKLTILIAAFVIFAPTVSLASSPGDECILGSIYDQLLSDFDRETYETFQRCLLDETASQAFNITNEQLHLLLESARADNLVSYNTLFDAVGMTGGGNMEDVLRKIGELAADDPVLFLSTVKKRQIRGKSLQNMVVMLPLSYVDDPEGKAAEILRRKAKFQSVEDVELRSTRDEIIVYLEKSYEFYKGVLKEEGSKPSSSSGLAIP